MEDNKRVFAGVVMPFKDGPGWQLTAENEIITAQTMLQWAIGKKTRVTVEADESRMFEGVVQTFDQGPGWHMKVPITPAGLRAGEKGICNGATMFQWAIGKKTQVTVEVLG